MAKILIHGKEYVPVADRLQEMRDAKYEHIVIETEVLQHEPTVVIKATITLDNNVYTGISAANVSKQIEKMSPYEVAETSAVGRALGFAGFGAVESIASADEMVKANYAEKVFAPAKVDMADIPIEDPFAGLVPQSDNLLCDECSTPLEIKVSGPTAKNPNKQYWACPTHKWKSWVAA